MPSNPAIHRPTTPTLRTNPSTASSSSSLPSPSSSFGASLSLSGTATATPNSLSQTFSSTFFSLASIPSLRSIPSTSTIPFKQSRLSSSTRSSTGAIPPTPASPRSPHPSRLHAIMGAHTTRYMPKAVEAGRSVVWCGGLCMTGPDYRGTILTFLLAVAIFTLECVFSFPWLFANRVLVAIPLFVAMVVTFAITCGAAYLASTTDPGIIPRSNVIPSSITAFPAIRERTVRFRGRSIALRYCDTCRIWRPPRTSHCATCNNCVRRFDHHCPWLGNDVGLRNYRSYFCFVVFASLSESIAIATSVLTLHWTTAHYRTEFPDEAYASSIRRALSHGGTAVNIALVLLSFLALLFTGGLTGFHLFLMWKNVTTAESFKKRPRNSAWVVDDYRGCRAICMLQCTTRQDSALVDGYDGPAFPEEEEMNRLVDAQVQEEQDSRAEGPTSVLSPPPAVSIPIGD